MNRLSTKFLLVLALLMTALPMAVFAEGAFDLELQFVNEDFTQKEVEAPTVMACTNPNLVFDANTDFSACDGNVTGIFFMNRFDRTYPLDFSKPVKKGDKYYIVTIQPLENGKYKFFYADGTTSDVLNKDSSKWFTVGKEHAIAINANQKYDYTYNEQVTRKMEQAYQNKVKASSKYKIKVTVNQVAVPLSSEPIIKNKIPYFSAKDICSLLDMEVSMDAAGSPRAKAYGFKNLPLVSIYRPGGFNEILMFTPGAKGSYWLGNTIGAKLSHQGDTYSFMKNGIIYVPVEEIMDIAGFKATWNAKTQTLNIVKLK